MLNEKIFFRILTLYLLNFYTLMFALDQKMDDYRKKQADYIRAPPSPQALVANFFASADYDDVLRGNGDSLAEDIAWLPPDADSARGRLLADTLAVLNESLIR